jgi:hypothetical protein
MATETLVERLALALLFLHMAAAAVLGQQQQAHMAAAAAGNFLLEVTPRPQALVELMYLLKALLPAHLT